MSYIGSTPTSQNFTSGTDYFSGTGSQTAFTLTRTVNSVNDIEVVINNVVQQPSTAYTLSGTTITFTSAPSSGTNNIYVRYLSTTTQTIAPSQGTVGTTQLVGGTVVTTADATLNGVTVGKGGGSVSTNTAVGASAGVSNTTGAQNTFIGSYAGSTNAGASYNTAIGYNSLTSNSSGAENTAVGVAAMGDNSTGSYNTAVGRQALKSNTTASNNTAVGYQAGYSGTTNGYNVFIGPQTGYSTTGSYNTFIGGNSAGYYVTTGSKNTILGNYQGNSGGLDIRTSSNYIVLSDGDGNPRGYADATGRWVFSNNIAGEVVTANNKNTSTPYGIYNGFSGAAPNNGSQWFYLSEDTGGLRCVIMANGGIKNYSANNVNLSDQSVKKDIELAGNYLDKICAIPVKTFLYIDQTDTEKNLGVIAQDVQAVAPELVTQTEWGTKENPETKLSVYEADLVFALMKSIQELKAEVDMLKAQLNPPSIEGNTPLPAETN